ncbi:MAG: hypothetical protein GF370_04770 [Candidatus Nealsonbacteria bacterium]|nr:hypothetical protein [Candidatus Nealsonbacteria bacterium]
MEKEITKETVESLMNSEGEVLGIGPKSDFEYIKHRFGNEGVEKLEAELERLGHPLKHHTLKDRKFYPIGTQGLIVTAMRNVFDLSDEDFQEVGEFSARLPLIMRVFMKYFFSIETVAREAPRMWRRYYTKGDFKVSEIDKEGKKAVIKISDFNLTPILCETFKGYFRGVVQMVVKGKATCEELKCPHRGDEHHEFLIRW